MNVRVIADPFRLAAVSFTGDTRGRPRCPRGVEHGIIDYRGADGTDSIPRWGPVGDPLRKPEDDERVVPTRHNKYEYENRLVDARPYFELQCSVLISSNMILPPPLACANRHDFIETR